MNQFTVHILARNGSRQLLFIAESNSICVYDEHSGHTLLRSRPSDLAALTQALDLLALHSDE